MTLLQNLESRLSRALENVLGEPCAANMTPAADLRFGDYQSNSAMVLAKKQKTNPRALAEQIMAAVEIDGLATAKIDGPGFLNFTILPEAYAAHAESLLGDPRLGAPEPGKGKTVVVDFSGPNVAKPMHVGHIRSTIIGDSLCRIARFLGFKVIADNHIGDWGTQFGMILHGWKTTLDHTALEADPISELVRVYRGVNAAAKDDPAVLETCKAELVKLQAGDPENLAIWQQCIDVSKAGLQKIYGILDVSFDHWLGESFYNGMLPGLVDEFLKKDLPGRVTARSAFFRTERSPPSKILSSFTRRTAGRTTRRLSARPTAVSSTPPRISRPSTTASRNGTRIRSGMWSACRSSFISARFSRPPHAGVKPATSATSPSVPSSAKTAR